MIMKSNLGKMLGRMAPQQGAGMTVQPQQPQLGGGLMAGLNRPNPQSGMTPSNTLANLGQMLSGQRPTRPTNTGNGMLVMPAIPQPYQQGPMAQPHIYNPVNTTTERDLRGPRGMGGMRNMFGVNPNDLAAMGGILPKLAEQFRNAEAMPSNWVSAPRQLTPEEAIAISSMPAAQPNVVVTPRPPEMPQGVGQISGVGNPIPKFDPNSALQNYNMTLKRLYEGGAKMDLNAAREQQGILRNLQTNLSATPEQHDTAYRAALSELRNRYPDAFAG